MMRHQFFRPVSAFVLMSMLMVATSDAEVEYDGSINVSGFVPGPNYIIDSGFGQQSGRNLFHSFKNFNIGAGENARFVGSSDISHIFARVTSGNTSVVNGLLSSDIDGASLWLINPKGIIFGQGSALDISGSFYATTANSIAFDDGRFDSVAGDSVLLPAGVPRRIEMLKDNLASIHVNNSNLQNEQDNGIYFVANNITLINTQLDASQVTLGSSGSIDNIVIEYAGENAVTRIQIEAATVDVVPALDSAIEPEDNGQNVETETVQSEDGQDGLFDANRDQLLFTGTSVMDKKKMEDITGCRAEGQINSIRNGSANSDTHTWQYPMGRYVSYSTFHGEGNSDNRCR